MSNSQDESLISAIKTLHDRYSFILEKCQQWNKQSPILGLYRYTNSLNAEKHFIEKVPSPSFCLLLLYLFIFFLVITRANLDQKGARSKYKSRLFRTSL